MDMHIHMIGIGCAALEFHGLSHHIAVLFAAGHSGQLFIGQVLVFFRSVKIFAPFALP